MKQNEPIKNIMSTKLVSANYDDKISVVKRMMQEHNIRHIPVVTDKKITGIVSMMDILRSSFSELFVRNEAGSEEQLDSVASLKDIMVPNVRTLRDTQTVRDACEVLLAESFNALPVINNNDELVGIVTTKDLVRYVMEQY